MNEIERVREQAAAWEAVFAAAIRIVACHCDAKQYRGSTTT